MADRNASGRRQPWRWESAEPARPARARVLLLSWHFPPGAAAGALRWEHPAALERSDEARLARLPAGTRIVGVRPPALRLEALENTLWRQWRRLRPRPAHGASPPAPAASLAAPALRFRPAEARSWIRAWTAWLDVARGRS